MAETPKFFFDSDPLNIRKQFDQALNLAKAQYRELEDQPKPQITFDNSFRRFDEIGARFFDATGPIMLLRNVSTIKDVRDVAQECEIEIDSFYSELYMRRELYEYLSAFTQTQEHKELQAEKKRLVDKVLSDFERSGTNLKKDTWQELLNLKKELVQLQSAFERNISEYNDFILVTKEDLKHFPDNYVSALEKESENTYKVSLSYPEYFPFMQNCSNEKLRKKLLQKMSQKGGKENIQILEKALKLRSKIAGILGYKNYASYVLEDRMAQNLSNVESFLEKIENKTSPLLKHDLDQLLERKKKDDPSANKIFAWDWRYYANQIKKKNSKLIMKKFENIFP